MRIIARRFSVGARFNAHLSRRLGRTHAAVPAIGAACRMTPNELRPRLAAMESHRLVGSRQDMGTRPPVRVVYVTAEGRRAAGGVDARAG